MVEVLVATTILMIIVMILSMIFQQSSGAYQSGARVVKSQTVLRGVLGAVARDLTLAVDSRGYPGIENSFGSGSIKFVALTGSPDASGRRTAQWIEFSNAGGYVTRRAGDLKWTPTTGGGTWSRGPLTSSVLNPQEPLTGFTFEIVREPGLSGDALPLRVDIQGSIETSGKATLVSGRSAGKDREFDTEDDIIVGGV